MTVKLTKNELRDQQTRLTQFQRYLPTLQLKKAMLQLEVSETQMEITSLKEKLSECKAHVSEISPLLLEKVRCPVAHFADVIHVKKKYENVAGVEIPIFDHIIFQEDDYFLFDAPVWAEGVTKLIRELVTYREKILIAEEKRRALEKELRDVSIRVNLFEKILIPRSQENIKKIRIFLGDQQLASVAQAKVAKKKLSLKKEGK